MGQRRRVPDAARGPLLDCAVAAARLERLRAEVALCRLERREAVAAAVAAGAPRTVVAERMHANRRLVWQILRAV